MTTVTVEEASANLPDLLRRIAEGEEVVITQDGKWVALLAEPPDPPPTEEEIAARRKCVKQSILETFVEMKSRRPILEQEIVVKDFSGNVCRGDNARSAFMPDTVGIGHYALDIHPNGHGEPNHYVATRPFQIPLGAMIPLRIQNLLPACKNLGTTHLSNGAYRLHPIEWNIGESAGLLAAYCLKNRTTPRQIHESPQELRRFQSALLREGIALHWYVDVPPTHPACFAVQTLAGFGVTLGKETDLLFRPDEKITSQDWNAWREASRSSAPADFKGTRAAAALRLLEGLS